MGLACRTSTENLRSKSKPADHHCAAVLLRGHPVQTQITTRLQNFVSEPLRLLQATHGAGLQDFHCNLRSKPADHHRAAVLLRGHPVQTHITTLQLPANFVSEPLRLMQAAHGAGLQDFHCKSEVQACTPLPFFFVGILYRPRSPTRLQTLCQSL